MAEVFLGSLMLVPYNFAPNNWAFCQGQTLAIRQYTALFSLLGTNFGGDGKTTFGLPNLQGAVPIGVGQGPGLSSYPLGSSGRVPSVTLQTNQVPSHQHKIQAVNARGNVTSPADAFLTTSPIYANGALVSLNSAALLAQGGSPGNNVAQPHNNLMPYVTLNWIIALQGIFPPRP